MPKGLVFQRRQRTEEVAEWLIRGMPDTACQKQAIEKWGVHLDTAKRYVRAAYALVQRQTSRGRQKRINLAETRLELAMKLALERKDLAGREDPDLQAFLRANEQHAKLLGLNAPTRHQVLVATLGDYLDIIREVLVDNISDIPTRQRVIDGIGAAAEHLETKLKALGARGST